MAERPLVLLVTFEGLARTVIDSTVLEHARYMADRGLARFEIFSFCTNTELYQESQERIRSAREAASCPVRLLRAVRPAVPSSVAMNAWRLRSVLKRSGLSPDLVHARGDYAAAVAGRAAARRIPVLWDCRADCVAEMRQRLELYRGAPGFVRRAKIVQEERVRRAAAQSCAAAVFVSTGLSAKFSASLAGKASVVAPCAASEDSFSWDPALRSATRRELGYRDDDIVYVFCGSLKPYQCFGQVVASIRMLRAQDSSTKLLVLTPDRKQAVHALQGLAPGIATVLSVEHKDVNRYLNAADRAFMLREAMPMNAVASPTKFAEYCLSGLPVIMTDAVADAVTTASALGNMLPVASLRPELDASYDRATVAQRAVSLLGREAVAKQYQRAYAAALAGVVPGR